MSFSLPPPVVAGTRASTSEPKITRSMLSRAACSSAAAASAVASSSSAFALPSSPRGTFAACPAFPRSAAEQRCAVWMTMRRTRSEGSSRRTGGGARARASRGGGVGGASRDRSARRTAVVPRAAGDSGGGGGGEDKGSESIMAKASALLDKVGLSLGPIGMTLGLGGGGSAKKPSGETAIDQSQTRDADASLMGKADALLDNAGLSLGPIGMTLGASATPAAAAAAIGDDGGGNKSIAPLSTAAWKKQNLNPDGTVNPTTCRPTPYTLTPRAETLYPES